mmetsp:Transcript_14362/g.34013  ORF Transcript_14362/g.34013 Transcript_14362/m.34013 type:complete len:288 (-) Transcript_14362:34-897(-)
MDSADVARSRPACIKSRARRYLSETPRELADADADADADAEQPAAAAGGEAAEQSEPKTDPHELKALVDEMVAALKQEWERQKQESTSKAASKRDKGHEIRATTTAERWARLNLHFIFEWSKTVDGSASEPPELDRWRVDGELGPDEPGAPHTDRVETTSTLNGAGELETPSDSSAGSTERSQRDTTPPKLRTVEPVRNRRRGLGAKARLVDRMSKTSVRPPAPVEISTPPPEPIVEPMPEVGEENPSPEFQVHWNVGTIPQEGISLDRLAAPVLKTSEDHLDFWFW